MYLVEQRVFWRIDIFHFGTEQRVVNIQYLPGFDQVLTEHLFECGIQCYLEQEQVHEELLGEVKENGFDV